MCNEIKFLQMINAVLVQGISATVATAFTNLEHGTIYKLRYLVKWTDVTGAEALSIQVGATGGTPAPVVYPVLGADGEPVTIGQLRRRELLCMKFINPTTTPTVIPAHFRLLNPVCPQIIVTPEVTA